MNKKLLEAERALIELLWNNGGKYDSLKAIKELSKWGHAEAEIRAAFWTLRATGRIDHKVGKLVFKKFEPEEMWL